MNTTIKSQIFNIVVLSIVSGTAGYIVGYPLLILSIFLFVYLLRLLVHLDRLENVLRGDSESKAYFTGVVGDLYSIFLKKNKQKNRSITKLEKQLHSASQRLDDFREGVVLFDQNYKVFQINKRAEQLLGLKASSDIGLSIFSLLRDPQLSEYLMSLQFKQPYNQSLKTIPPRWLEFSVSHFDNHGFVLIIRDTTEKIVSDQQKQDFIANMSHEIRTPIAIIKGYSELLLLPYEQVDAEKRGQATQGITQQVSRMNRLVDSLTTLIDLESKKNIVKHSNVNVPALLKKQIDELSMLATYNGQKITLNIDEQIGLFADVNAIEGIVSNLLSNACKYTSNGNTIKIDWLQNGNGLFLRVEDDGNGIEYRHLHRLTERLYRVEDSRNPDTGGMGLGLAIVKHALLAHQSDLKIESQIGRGSCFTCHFPATMAIEL